jgi:hypothetical protein
MFNTSRLLLLAAALSSLGLAQEEKVKLPQEVILAPGQTASHFARMFRGAFCEVEKLVFTVTVTPENQKLIRVNFPKAEVGSEVAFVGNCRAEVWRYMPTGKYVVSDVNSGVAAMTPVPEPIGTKKPALQTRTATKKSPAVAKAAVPTPVKKSAPAPKAVVATAPKPLAPKAPAKVAVKATPKPAGVAKVPTPAKEKKQVAAKVTPKVEQPVQPKAKPQVAKALPPPPAPKPTPTPTPSAPPTRTAPPPPVQTEEARRLPPCPPRQGDYTPSNNMLVLRDCEEVVQKGDSQAGTTAETVLPSPQPDAPTPTYQLTDLNCAIWIATSGESQNVVTKPANIPWCGAKETAAWRQKKDAEQRDPAKDSNGLAKGEAKVVTTERPSNLILFGRITAVFCLGGLIILGYCFRAHFKVNKRSRQTKRPVRMVNVVSIEPHPREELLGKFRMFLLSKGVDKEPKINETTGAAEVLIGAGEQGAKLAKQLSEEMGKLGWRSLNIRLPNNPNGRVWLIAGTPPSKPAQQVIDAQAAQA